MIFFRAWIPNVSGRLSFSNIGPKGTHKRNFGRNITHEEGVDLLCVDTRNSSDTSSVFGRFVKSCIDKLLGKQGEYVFLTTGHSDKNFEALSGFVFKFTMRSWRSSFVKNKSLEEIEFPQDESSVVEYRQKMKALIDGWKLLCGRNGNHFATFTLSRSGEIQFEFDEISYEFEANFDEAASSIYRFFREICHTHQHHSNRNDVLLDAYRHVGEGNKWRSEALYSMMRYVIMARRARDVESYQNALGVAAYAQAFYKSFRKPNEVDEELPVYNFEELRFSLSAGLDRAKTFEQKIPSWISLASFIFALLTLMLLIFRVSLSLRNDVSSVLGELPVVGDFTSLEWQAIFAYNRAFINDPLSTTFAIALGCFLVCFVFHRFLNEKLNNWQLDFLRLFLAKYKLFGMDFSILVRALVVFLVLFGGAVLLGTGLSSVFGEHGLNVFGPSEMIELVRNLFQRS